MALSRACQQNNILHCFQDELALHKAAAENKSLAIRRLLMQGADVNLQDDEVSCLLFRSCSAALCFNDAAAFDSVVLYCFLFRSCSAVCCFNHALLSLVLVMLLPPVSVMLCRPTIFCRPLLQSCWCPLL